MPFALLEAVAEVVPRTPRAGLARLQGAEFLYETILFPESEYTFKHALSHEVAYGSLLQERRRALHGRIVEAIERLYPDRLAEQSERLAAHARRGEIWEKAVTYLRAAGARAVGHSANREAVGFFDQALEALGNCRRAARPSSRPSISGSTFATPCSPWARWRPSPITCAAPPSWPRCSAISAGWAGSPRTCRTTSGGMGDLGRAIESGQRALTIAEELQDVGLHTTNVNLGLAYYTAGDYPHAIQCVRKTIAILQGDHARRRFGWAGVPAIISRAYLIGCLTELGEFAEGARLADEVIRLGEAAEHPFSLGQAYISVGILHVRSGDLARAIPILERALTLSRVSDVAALFPGVASALGYAYALAGRTAEGIPLLENAIAHAAIQPDPGPRVAVEYLAQRGVSPRRVADPGARDRPAGGRPVSRAGGARQRGPCAPAAAEVFAQDDKRIDDAEPAYRLAIALAEELGMRPLQAHCHRGLGVLYLKLGQQEPASAALSTAIDLYLPMDMTFWLPQAEAALAQVKD